jgi:hypothetical protein
MSQSNSKVCQKALNKYLFNNLLNESIGFTAHGRLRNLQKHSYNAFSYPQNDRDLKVTEFNVPLLMQGCSSTVLW